MYGALLIALQAAGLASSLWFLAIHRPRHWRRLQALDAMGFPLIIAMVFARGLILTILSWPVPGRPAGNMAFSLVMLALVDAWMLVKLANFRRFIRQEGHRSTHPSLYTVDKTQGRDR